MKREMIRMSTESEVTIQAKATELERLIREFKEKIENGTSDSAQFISMNEIERLWGELSSNTNNIYSDMVQTLISSVDETDLIRKKKENIAKRESV
jgi:hypothetical protein